MKGVAGWGGGGGGADTPYDCKMTLNSFSMLGDFFSFSLVLFILLMYRDGCGADV